MKFADLALGMPDVIHYIQADMEHDCCTTFQDKEEGTHS